MQGRTGRIGIEEENEMVNGGWKTTVTPSSENDLLLFALQTLARPPDHLKDNLNDGRREGCNDWVFRRILMRRAAIPTFPPLSLSLQRSENFDKFILCLGEPTTGSLPFIEAIENHI